MHKNSKLMSPVILFELELKNVCSTFLLRAFLLQAFYSDRCMGRLGGCDLAQKHISMLTGRTGN